MFPSGFGIAGGVHDFQTPVGVQERDAIRAAFDEPQVEPLRLAQRLCGLVALAQMAADHQPGRRQQHRRGDASNESDVSEDARLVHLGHLPHSHAPHRREHGESRRDTGQEFRFDSSMHELNGDQK